MRVMPAFTTRFAPAPTGYLHLGHVVNAVWVWGYARAHDGRVLLRLEDHDAGRCRPEYEAAILDDLDWLGFVPDGATTDTFRAGAHPQRQSDNRARYLARLTELETTELETTDLETTARTTTDTEASPLAYPCICSRTEIRTEIRTAIARAAQFSTGDPVSEFPEAHELRYPGTCRTRGINPSSTAARRVRMGRPLESGRPAVEQFDDLRLGPQVQDPVAQCGDILARDRHGNFTYQFAVVVDDIDQEIDLVIRGADLLDSTGRQIRLARTLGRSTPARFLHHPLVRHLDGSKLSKSAGDTGIRELRAAGMSAAEVLGRACAHAGVSHDGSPIDARDIAALFAHLPSIA